MTAQPYLTVACTTHVLAGALGLLVPFLGGCQRSDQPAGLVPENEKYRGNMATALGLLGRHEEALALLQQILPRNKAENNAELLHKAYDQAHQTTSDPPA